MSNPMSLRWLLPVLILLGLAAFSPNAWATLLFAGGEDVDFLCNSGGSCSTVSGSAAFYRTAWAREAYGVSGTGNDPPTNRFATPTFTAASTLWVHAQYCTTFSNIWGTSCVTSSSANVQMLRLLDSSGNPTLIVRGTGTAGQLVISSRTSTGTFTDLVTCSSAFSPSLTQLDLYVNYGTSGEVKLYNNSVPVCDFTGNVTNGDGATTLNQVEFATPSGDLGAWSEVIIATTDTRTMARFTANTVGDGNTTGFSGTNICSAIWNAPSFNDTSYGYTGSSGVMHECTINSSVPAGSYTVIGLVMSARAAVGTSSPLHFDFMSRVNGTDYASGDFAPTTAFTNLANYIQALNPATGNPWTVSDFQASGFNVGEESKP